MGVAAATSSPTPLSRNATTIAQQNKHAVTDISQNQCTAYSNAAGYTAHNHADHNATGAATFADLRAIPRASKHRAAISYTAGATAAENALSTTISANAAPRVYTPNTLNAAPISSGYTGGSQAVGPDIPLNGFAYPCPIASDRAIRPASNPKSKFPCPARIRYVCPTRITITRSANPTQKITHGARNPTLPGASTRNPDEHFTS